MVKSISTSNSHFHGGVSNLAAVDGLLASLSFLCKKFGVGGGGSAPDVATEGESSKGTDEDYP